jgi:hypothetical protein
MTVYRASADGLVIGITAVVILVLGAIAAGGLAAAAFSRAPGWLRSVLLLPTVLCLGILVAAYAYTPREFRLSDDALVVARPAGDVIVPLQGMTEVRAVPSPVSGSIRLGGNGGLFGFWGRYHNDTLGSFTLYGKRATGGVALVTPDAKVVITPDEPEKFVADIQQRLGRRVAG